MKAAKKVGAYGPVPTWELAPSLGPAGHTFFNHCLTSITPRLTTVNLRVCRHSSFMKGKNSRACIGPSSIRKMGRLQPWLTAGPQILTSSEAAQG